MTNKEKYRQLCEEEPTIPIFSQAWWLDAVAGESWDVCIVEKGNKIQASMPYVVKKKYGLTLLTQPSLTQNLGPWIRSAHGKYSKQLSREKDLMEALIEQLPHHHYFNQNWHYSNTNWLPFYWKGFEQSTRYTYLIDGLQSLTDTEIFSEFSSSYKNKIRKAEKVVSIQRGLDPERFYLINEKTFARQGIDIPYSKSFFLKQDEACKEKSCREIFFAEDENGALHSALYLTWDSMSSYVHLVGEDPEYRSSGAGILLIWEAIKYTKDVLNLSKFDFEGSMIESVERVRRECGGKQMAYHRISCFPSRWFNTVLSLKRAIKGQL